MVRAHFIIGVIGGVIGLLMTPLNLIVGVVAVVFSLGSFPQLLLLTGIGALMAVLGIVGAVVSRSHPQTGGLLMLISGIVPLLLGGIMMISAGLAGAIVPLYALYFWAFILVLAGLISVLQSGARKPPRPPPPVSGSSS